jgi:hypothetical protein
MMDWQVPTLAEVLEARRRITPHLRSTPLYSYGGLHELVDAEVFVKHENHQPPMNARRAHPRLRRGRGRRALPCALRADAARRRYAARLLA